MRGVLSECSEPQLKLKTLWGLMAQQAAETHPGPGSGAALSAYSNTNNHQRLLGGFFLWGEKHRFSNPCMVGNTDCCWNSAYKSKKKKTCQSNELIGVFFPPSLQLKQNCRWSKHYLAANKLCTVCKHRFLQTLTGSHLLTAGKIANYVLLFSTQTRLR